MRTVKELCEVLGVDDWVIFTRAAQVYPNYGAKPQEDTEQWRRTGLTPIYVDLYLYSMRTVCRTINGHH